MPSLCLEPVSEPKKITTIEAWRSCFLIFVGIYTSKYPAEAPAFMKYGKIIQDLVARGHSWSYYDQNFRCYGRDRPLPFLGAFCMGNCGFVHNLH